MMLFILTYLFFLTGAESYDLQKNDEPDLIVECKLSSDWRRKTYDACGEDPYRLTIDFEVKKIISGNYYYDNISVLVNCPKQKFATGELQRRKLNTLTLVRSELVELNEFHKTDSAKYVYIMM